MTFLEPWSKNTKISDSAFEPYELPDDDTVQNAREDFLLNYQELDYNEESENQDPGTYPDISGYERITFEEIVDQFCLGKSGDVDWDKIKKESIKNCKYLVGLWAKSIKDDFDRAPIIDEGENPQLLGLVRKHLIVLLGIYSEITDFCAWLDQAYERLEEMQNKRDIALMAKIFPNTRAQRDLKNQIDNLDNEIKEFEKEWGIRERIYELEEHLLESYRKYVVSNQKEIANYRLKKLRIGQFGPKPQSREIKNSYDFEHYCRDWLVYLGARNALVSSATQDGGVDVISEDHIAQVKLYNGPIPVSQVRDLLGTSVDFGKLPIFFASMAFSKGSIEFADRNGIPLIVVDAYNGSIRGANQFGKSLVAKGITHQD